MNFILSSAAEHIHINADVIHLVSRAHELRR